MCLYPTHKRVKIAKEDIVCYKVLTSIMKSPYRDFQYERNKMYSIKLLKIDKNNNDLEINEGYHAYVSYDGAYSSTAIMFLYDTFIFKAIIPKGSKYYLGTDNEIVSNQMIIKENINE